MTKQRLPGQTGERPLDCLPDTPPTYDPSRRLYGPLPNPTSRSDNQSDEGDGDDGSWNRYWPGLAVGAAIGLALVLAVVAGSQFLRTDPGADLVSLGAGGGIDSGENLALRGEALDVQGVLALVAEAVVSVETDAISFRGVFEGAGSGVIIDNDGLVLTNAHVVESADALHVVFFDGTRAPAKLVALAADDDVALLQVQGVTDTHAAKLGSSSRLLVGDQVLAIGNALGLGGDPTVTLGIVSAKNRTIDAGRVTFDDLIQTDAAINPGNSGGPLVNAAGEIIGINTAIIEGSQNVGFAISIDSVMAFLDRYRSDDAAVTLETAWFGASARSLNNFDTDERAALGLDPETKGVYIVDVFDGSAADRAGLRIGDVITAIEGTEVDHPEDVARIVRSHDPGESIEVTYLRGSVVDEVSAILRTRADADD